MTDARTDTPPLAKPARRRRWPRILLLCLGGLTALAGAVVWMTFRLTNPAVFAVETFLRATADGGPAEVAGTMTFQDGNRVPVKITLVKSQEQWRVLAMRFPASGAQSSETPIASAAATTPPPQQWTQDVPSPLPSVATPPTDATAMPVRPANGTNPPRDATASPSYGLTTAPAVRSSGSGVQGPGVAVSSLSPPGGYAPAAPTIPAAKVAGICMYLFSNRAHLALDGVSCATGLAASPGASVRCVARKNGQEAGVTATLQSYDSSSSHPELSCVMDSSPT